MEKSSEIQKTIMQVCNGPSLRTAEIAALGNDTLYIVGGSTGLYATDKLEGFNTEWTQIGTEIIGNVLLKTFAIEKVTVNWLLIMAPVYSTIITSIYDVFPDLASIKEIDDNKNINIFPNPATEKVIVEWSNNDANRIIVSDASGKVVLSEKTTNLMQ